MAAPITQLKGCFRMNIFRKSSINLPKLCRFYSKKTSPFARRKYIAKSEKTVKLTISKLSGNDPSKTKKRKWYDDAMVSSMAPSFGDRPSKYSIGTERRARQLSVILFERISSLMNSGEIAPELPDLGFQIDRVKITLDFGIINVYWLATGSRDDDKIQQILDVSAGKLRSALIGLKIMGHLPPVQFVKDMSEARMQEVERLLKMADFGSDHVPTELGMEMKEEHSLYKRPVRKTSLQDHLDKITSRFDTQHLVHSTGPGGTVEVTRDHRFQSRDSFVAADADQISHTNNAYFTAGNVTSDRSSLKQNDINTADSIYKHIVDENLDRKSSDSDPELSNLSAIDVRNDIYDLDHSSLMQQVTFAKRKIKDRAFALSQQELENRKHTECRGYNSSSATSQKFLVYPKIKRRLQNRFTNVALTADSNEEPDLERDDHDEPEEDDYSDVIDNYYKR